MLALLLQNQLVDRELVTSGKLDFFLRWLLILMVQVMKDSRSAGSFKETNWSKVSKSMT